MPDSISKKATNELVSAETIGTESQSRFAKLLLAIDSTRSDASFYCLASARARHVLGNPKMLDLF